MENTQLKELRLRAGKLSEAILRDPDRPFWQAEFVNILVGLADVVDLLANDSISCAGDLSGVRDRIQLLETRYSELLYRLSDRT